MSWTLALPAPDPPPPWEAPVCATPQLQARTSISPLCLSSLDSPLMSSSFKNMSAAMDVLPFVVAPKWLRGGPYDRPVVRRAHAHSTPTPLPRLAPVVYKRAPPRLGSCFREQVPADVA